MSPDHSEAYLENLFSLSPVRSSPEPPGLPSTRDVENEPLTEASWPKTPRSRSRSPLREQSSPDSIDLVPEAVGGGASDVDAFEKDLRETVFLKETGSGNTEAIDQLISALTKGEPFQIRGKKSSRVYGEKNKYNRLIKKSIPEAFKKDKKKVNDWLNEIKRLVIDSRLNSPDLPRHGGTKLKETRDLPEYVRTSKNTPESVWQAFCSAETEKGPKLRTAPRDLITRHIFDLMLIARDYRIIFDSPNTPTASTFQFIDMAAALPS